MSYRLFLAVFYIVLIAICMCGQIAILIKKCIELQKDEMDANLADSNIDILWSESITQINKSNQNLFVFDIKNG